MVRASAAYAAYALLSTSQRRWLAWTFVDLAILYSPIFRVHFERETWSIINVISPAPCGVLGRLARRDNREWPGHAALRRDSGRTRTKAKARGRSGVPFSLSSHAERARSFDHRPNVGAWRRLT